MKTTRCRCIWGRSGKAPLVTADGFAPQAIVVDPATGCHIWQAGCTVDGVPIAQHGGRRRYLRQLVWERAGRPLDPSLRLTTTCGNPRCLALAHLAPIVARPQPAPQPRRPHPLRSRLAERLPTAQPANLSEREWAILCGIRDGHSLAALAAALGLSRQRVNEIAWTAVARLPA